MRVTGILRDVNDSEGRARDIALTLQTLEKCQDLVVFNNKNFDLVEELLAELEDEVIDKDELFRHHSIPDAAYLNSYLIDEVWEHIQFWAKKSIDLNVKQNCEIQVLKELSSNALGIFRYDSHGNCVINIREDVLENEHLLLVVLLHEYMHYLHYKMVPIEHYLDCPAIFIEGFAEFATRSFHNTSKYQLPSRFQKSWDVNYELGRKVLWQICINESFGLKGFFHAFLYNMPADSPWKCLDARFSH